MPFLDPMPYLGKAKTSARTRITPGRPAVRLLSRRIQPLASARSGVYRLRSVSEPTTDERRLLSDSGRPVLHERKRMSFFAALALRKYECLAVR